MTNSKQKDRLGTKPLRQDLARLRAEAKEATRRVAEQEKMLAEALCPFPLGQRLEALPAIARQREGKSYVVTHLKPGDFVEIVGVTLSFSAEKDMYLDVGLRFRQRPGMALSKLWCVNEDLLGVSVQQLKRFFKVV